MHIETKYPGQQGVVVIGAGPSGSLASALLVRNGHSVVVLEKTHFPRFSIGESLLPQCMAFLEEADMLKAVEAASFQHKNGAAFSKDGMYESFDFSKKFTSGPETTFQVQRDRFDQILANEAVKQGVEIRYGHGVTRLTRKNGISVLSVESEQGNYQLPARFVLDASGFGRVLPRLLGLHRASPLAERTSIFTHVEDRINSAQFERNKTLIVVHPQNDEVWFWLIPFSNGRSSVGVVARQEFLQQHTGTSTEVLKTCITETGWLDELLQNAVFDTQVRAVTGYSCQSSTLYGDGFALLGNSGEFLDPVFSSGVTIALKSATLAASVLSRELCGEQANWQMDYAKPLQRGTEVFRQFVQSWYNGGLWQVIFFGRKNPKTKSMISAILAGYAWDTQNPYVNDPSQLSTLVELCREK